MKTYQELMLKVITFDGEHDVITTSATADNLVAGKLSWDGWSEGGQAQ